MPDAEPQESKKNRSRGEKLFNWITYGGVAGLGTFVTTIPLAYWAKYGKGAGGLKWAAGHLKKIPMMSENSIEQALNTTALMQGGNLMLLPVAALEHNKPAIVEKLNKMLGEPDSIAQVEKEPPQSWGSLIKARLAAWGMIFLSFKAVGKVVGYEKFEQFENKFAGKIVCGTLGKPTHIAGQETRLFRLGKIAALDVFATAASSTLLYVGSRFFAKGREKKHARREEQAALSHAAQDIAPCAPKNFAGSVISRAHPEGFAEAVASRKSNPTEPLQAL